MMNLTKSSLGDEFKKRNPAIDIVFLGVMCLPKMVPSNA